jgi:hypothetical protein
VERIRELLVEWDIRPRTVLAVGALTIVLLVILAFPYLNRGGEVTEIEGVAVAPFDQPAEAANRYYMRVALASGEEIRVPISRDTPVKAGKAVVLARQKGRLGFTSYEFRRYVEAGN